MRYVALSDANKFASNVVSTFEVVMDVECVMLRLNDANNLASNVVVTAMLVTVIECGVLR